MTHVLPVPPPANIEVERALLGALLIDNAVYTNVCDFLKSDHFADPTHQNIYKAACVLIRKGDQASPVTLRHYFEQDGSTPDGDGAQYLMELATSAFTTIYAEDHAHTLVDLWQRRELMVVLDQQHEQLAAPTIDRTAEEIGGNIVGDVSRVMEGSSKSAFSRRSVLEDITNDLPRPLESNSTGLAELDASMGGGLYARRLYGVAARMKIGKTLLAGSISYNLNEAGVRHLFVCGEMSPAEIEQRNIARALGFNAMQFLKEQHRGSKIFQEKVAQYAVTAPSNVIYEHAPGLSFDDLQRMVYGAVMREGVKGVIVDYLQLVGGQQRGQSKAEHFDAVAQWLADVSRKRNIWVLVLAQLNQDTQSPNIRYSEGLRLACDQLYALHRDDETNLAWMEMWATRYTAWRNAGTRERPSLRLEINKGPFFESLNLASNEHAA
jgi:replicative DNA helicase